MDVWTDGQTDMDGLTEGWGRWRDGQVVCRWMDRWIDG